MPVSKYKDGRLPNLLAVGWAFGAYVAGLWLCLADSIAANVGAVLLLAHAMIIAAYLLHECAHNTIFVESRWNARLGAGLNWITGAIYSPYEQIRHKHMRHHVDRADVVAFDYRDRLRSAPNSVRKTVQALEWLGVPVVEIWLRTLAIVLPFRAPTLGHLRRRVLILAAVRLAVLGALAAISPRILLLYPLAYMASLQVLRLMDAHQHTFDARADLYDADVTPGPAAGLDRDFENRNTFSNPLSERWPMLNLLVLNFGYHNAHHLRPSQPWYRLPALHAEHYGVDNSQTLVPADVRRTFIRYRVARSLNEDRPDSGMTRARAREFVGVDGVSFLVPF